MMTTNDAPLLFVDRLEEALGSHVPGREREWGEQVGGALAGVEVSVRQHATSVEAPDGMYARVDLSRPTLARRVSETRNTIGPCRCTSPAKAASSRSRT
jgi:hypothetical protein